MKTLLCLLFCMPVFAWGQKILELSGSVADNLTYKPITGCVVELLQLDSTVLLTKKAGGWYQEGDMIEHYAKFWLTIPKEGTYLVRFTKEGYETTYIEFEAINFAKREIEKKIPTVYMQRIRMLKVEEVKVTATKVKFYHKGDTIVYNASAFQLSEGSMLDALISQLPGVEIKSGGQIHVDGKLVENLLLNGEYFFKGNNKVMLENLPNYMVQNISVYEKDGQMSEFLGRDVGDGSLVMDVRLKRKYAAGWLFNVGSGYGTADRYAGNIFATRFTDRSRFTFYGNTNNTNDERKPGQQTEWTPENMSDGLLTTRMAGIDYYVKVQAKNVKINGDIQYKDTDQDLQNVTNRTNFLPQGDTYDRREGVLRNKNMLVSTSHKFNLKRENLDLNIRPSVSYRTYNSNSNNQSGTFLEDYNNFDDAQLDSIFTPELGTSLREVAINRSLIKEKLSGYDLNGEITASSTIKIKKTPDALNLSGFATFEKSGEDKFIQNQIDYYSEEDVTTDFLNQYYNNNPGEGYNYGLKTRYMYGVTNTLNLSAYYEYGQRYSLRERSIYSLDQVDGWGVGTSNAIGMLPSVSAYERTLDFSNSYESRLYENRHKLGLSLRWSKYHKNSSWWTQVDIPTTIYDQKLKYKQGDVDTLINRQTALVELTSTFLQWRTLDRKHTILFTYNINSQAPDLTYMVNVSDSTDPLNVTIGNSNLQNTYTHIYRLSYTNRDKEKQRTISARVHYNFIKDALAMGYTYDKLTGVRTIQPANVDGNNKLGFEFSIDTPLDKLKRITLRSSTFANYSNSVDLIGVRGALESNRSIVNLNEIREEFRLNYKINESTIGMKSTASWVNATSARVDFNEINVVDFNYGFVADVKLPWQLRLASDILMYSRRGYVDSSMNTNDLVWNARISRSVLKGKLLLMIDGFDILGQLSNVNKVINAQGLTETYTNVIPSYVMLRVNYKFDLQPKKRG